MTVNVRDFGAVGDGEHDDTAAFQTAIDAAAMETLPPDVVRTLEGRLRGVAAETARRDARMLAIGTPEPAEAGIYQTQRLPSRIGVGDGPDVPCRFVAVDMAFRPSEPFPHVPLPATVVSGERGEDGVLRFDVTFDRDALARWIASMTEAFRAFGEQMRVTAEATVGVMRPLGEWIEQNRDAIERAAAEDANRYLRARAVAVAETLHNPDDEEMVRRFSQVRTASDFMVDADGAPTDPELETAKNWLAGGSTCAHVCGPDPGHVCDARATATLQHPLPSGGTRTLPLCRPCADAEDTGGLAVPIPDQPRHSARIGALLTAADPEPPAGTVVEMEWGERWWRDGGPGPCEWFPMSQFTNPDRHDPESWTKVAGDYGPVRVVVTP